IYYIVCFNTGEKPHPWAWELKRSGEPMGVRISERGYQSKTAAEHAGMPLLLTVAIVWNLFALRSATVLRPCDATNGHDAKVGLCLRQAFADRTVSPIESRQRIEPGWRWYRSL